MNPFFSNIERYPIEVNGFGEGARLYGRTDGIPADSPAAWPESWLDFWSDESTQGGGYDMSDLLMRFARSGIPHQLPDIYPNYTRTALATRLCETYGYSKVFFGNSGADAIETAIKIARKYQARQGNDQKRKLYTLKGNFHGRSMGALSLSDSVGSGSPYHKQGYATTGTDEMLTQAGLPWMGYGVIDENKPLEEQIDEQHAAAIFMAPVLGNNVVKGYSVDFLTKLRRYCWKHDILLVFDEIQTGSGWTGHYSAADMYGVYPDIMTLGKRIAYGFPMSATLVSRNTGYTGLEDSIGLGEHFNTFAGSPFVCWFATQWLSFLGNGGLADIAFKGDRIAHLLTTTDYVSSVNQYGMMISFLPDYDRLGADGRAICEEARKRGLLIVTHRPKGEIRFTPPIAVTNGQIDEAIDILRATLNHLAQG